MQYFHVGCFKRAKMLEFRVDHVNNIRERWPPSLLFPERILEGCHDAQTNVLLQRGHSGKEHVGNRKGYFICISLV